MSAIQTESQTLIPTGTWAVDPVHSSIRFDVVDTDSMMKSISGRFTDFEGTVEGGEEQSARGVVHTPSVLTDNEQRDAHLRSNDLLGTERYPKVALVDGRLDLHPLHRNDLHHRLRQRRHARDAHIQQHGRGRE